MAMTYSSFVSDLAGMGVYNADDADFLAEVPRAITYAEKRLYRDLQLLATNTTEQSLSLAVDDRTVDISGISDRIIVLDGINLLTPAGTTFAEGTRNRLIRTALAYIDLVYPSNDSAGQPVVYAMLNENTLVFGPWPDDAYPIELVGTIRPAELSASNTETILTRLFPDIFLVAAMIHMAGFKNNFGSMQDNPQMAMSWETQYSALLASAATEEARKKAGAL